MNVKEIEGVSESYKRIMNDTAKASVRAAVYVAIFLLFLTYIYAVPSGPSVTVLSNSTRSISGGTVVNSTINGSSPGGFIFTLSLDSPQQNTRWKAYVGNVTGTLTLDDASDNTIFSWTLTSVTGEVYASRGSTINWTGINCTWIADGNNNASQGVASSNRSPEHNENQALSHTSSNDNITSTFRFANHSTMTIGGRVIGKNNCFSVHTYQNDNPQVFLDSDDGNFTEIILFDGAFNKTSGNVVYATFIEENIRGYRNQGTVETYDFQMLLPENGAPGFSASTGYYFYVELS